MTEPEWRRLNRANWDEKVPIHLNAPLHYARDRLTTRPPAVDPLAAAVLGPVDGLDVLHLQCHFGMDSLNLARLGARVVGLDFSAPAIEAARELATELGLDGRASFVNADVYDAPSTLPRAGDFDRVFVSWGALCWLPDMAGWARVVAHFLRPGGYLALAEAHPFAYVFDNAKASPDGMPGWYAGYLERQPHHENNPIDYADPTARLVNSRTVEFIHPISDILNGLMDAGLRIERFQEHDSIVWQMFTPLVGDDRAGFRWPDRPWLPLSFSLRARLPG